MKHFIANSEDPEATEEEFNELNPMPGWIQSEDVAAAVAELHLFNNCGHFEYMQAPKKFMDLIFDFYDK